MYNIKQNFIFMGKLIYFDRPVDFSSEPQTREKADGASQQEECERHH